MNEHWFNDIWSDAIHVGHAALQGACEELEVAVAALDVIFSMLKSVIHMVSALSIIGHEKLTGVPLSSTTSKGNKKGSSSNASSSSSTSSQRQGTTMPLLKPSSSQQQLQHLVSKDEFQRLQSSKEVLWKLTWTAVHHSAAFPCPCPELALAIAQRVLDFYRSRAEHEFRYSENIRVLLEISITVGQTPSLYDYFPEV